MNVYFYKNSINILQFQKKNGIILIYHRERVDTWAVKKAGLKCVIKS